MKSVFFMLALCFASVSLKAQYYNDVLSYNLNDTTFNGVKIKTNLPYVTNTQMPTVMIEGFAEGYAAPINLTLVYFINSTGFINCSVSSSGATCPVITLAGENGKVVILIESKAYYQRLHVRTFGLGRSGETAANYAGWTAVDSALIPTAAGVTVVPYKNAFAGNVSMPGNGIWNSLGKIGIGTATPRANLDVASVDSNTTTAILGHLNEGNGTGSGTYLGVQAYSTAPVNSKSFALEHKYYGNLNSAINFFRGASTLGGFMTFSTNNGTERMRIDGSGNVGIGTTAPGAYKLAVEGTIGARRVDVKQTSWADFVFQPDYQLPSLREVENYINANKHLSDIPSADEVAKNGLDLGEMNKKLLQKVEELTLYLINQEKRIQQLEAAKK